MAARFCPTLRIMPQCVTHHSGRRLVYFLIARRVQHRCLVALAGRSRLANVVSGQAPVCVCWECAKENSEKSRPRFVIFASFYTFPVSRAAASSPPNLNLSSPLLASFIHLPRMGVRRRLLATTQTNEMQDKPPVPGPPVAFTIVIFRAYTSF